LGGDGQAAAVDGFEDLVATALQQCGAGVVAELFGVFNRSVARIAEQFGTIGIGDEGFEVQLAVAHFREGADGDLAASAQAVEQGAFASCSRAGRGIVQELEVLACGGIS
jgi:hypothetical protein